jgi:imidazolonepropionase-like amidohydrolase
MRYPALLVVGLCLSSPGVGQAQPAEKPIVLVGARVFDGTGRLPLENATLILRGGHVEALGPELSVPANTQRVVDLKGKTIIPGLINSHGHVGDTLGLRSGAEFNTPENVRAQLRLYAQYGVTTVQSLGGDRDAGFAARAEQDRPGLDRARLYVAGPVVPTSGTEAIRSAIKELAARKVDWVKIRVDDNLGTTAKMSREASGVAIEAAHASRLRVAAHMFYFEDARVLVEQGVELLAHSIRDEAVPRDFAEDLVRRNVCVCPTLVREVSAYVYADKPDFFSDKFFLAHADRDVMAELGDPERRAQVKASPGAKAYRRALDVAQRNLKTLADAGVGVAFGTDSGPPGRFQGYFEHVELELMVQAGLTPKQALVAATGDAARCLGLRGRVGTLEPGNWADFLVLSANPLADIRNTRKIESVWIAGRPLS